MSMTFFVKATPAPEPRSKQAWQIAIAYAVVLVAMAVAQLFSFEEFLTLLTNFNLPLGVLGAYLLASALVICEVFALPFLLRMSLSKAFRWVSMVCGWLVAAIWLKLSLWVLIMRPDVDTVGFLGTVVSLTPGWWAVLVSLALAVVAIWASWGLWPGKRANVKATSSKRKK